MQQKEYHATGVTLTLGELRGQTAHLPDDFPVTIGQPQALGSWYWNVDGMTVPGGDPDSDDQPSVIFEIGTDVDTRQW
jgi:hypothetical protein